MTRNYCLHLLKLMPRGQGNPIVKPLPLRPESLKTAIIPGSQEQEENRTEQFARSLGLTVVNVFFLLGALGVKKVFLRD